MFSLVVLLCCKGPLCIPPALGGAFPIHAYAHILKLMEAEVAQFLEALGSQPAKDTQAVKSISEKFRESAKNASWNAALQRQLVEGGFWKSAPAEQQLSFLYILHNYFKVDKKAASGAVAAMGVAWADTVAHLLEQSCIVEGNDKRHVLKIIQTWTDKSDKRGGDRSKKGPQGDRDRGPLFPREKIDLWLGLFQPRPENNHHSQTASSAPYTPHTPSLGALGGGSLSPDVSFRMQREIVKAMGEMQIQVFKAFLLAPRRKLERWNIKVVMATSFHLLSIYVLEQPLQADDALAALLTACVYLAGKAEYCFVRADRLRDVVNRHVRVINDEPVGDNAAVFRYETALLRLLGTLGLIQICLQIYGFSTSN
ncbi:hypothetical protein B484DRAFT_464971, partial [Ochromonadaceae sp. CCMP2298]